MTNFITACLSALLLAASLPVLAQDKTPAIAAAANGATASAAVGNQLGRNPSFLLFDAQGALVAAEPNPYKDAGNAGVPALDLFAGKGVKTVVAENFGRQFVKVMADKGIRPVEFKGTARNAARKAAELR